MAKPRLTPKQQETLDFITSHAKKHGNCGGGEIKNPQTQAEKRLRKLYDLGLILYVGCGAKVQTGFARGCGLIPATMFDPEQHTKLAINPIIVSVEQIKPGRWFHDGGGRRFMKIQELLPSGIGSSLLRVQPETGQLIGDFAVNAIDDNGAPGCCPYGMDIFEVENLDDLYDEETVKLAPTVRHITVRSDPRQVTFNMPCAVDAEDYHAFEGIRYLLTCLLHEEVKYYEPSATDLEGEGHARVKKYATQPYVAIFYVGERGKPTEKEVLNCSIAKG